MTKAKKAQNKGLKTIANAGGLQSTRPDPLGVLAVRKLRSTRPRRAASPPPQLPVSSIPKNLSIGDMRHSLDARGTSNRNPGGRQEGVTATATSVDAIEDTRRKIEAAQAKLDELLEEQQNQRRASMQERLRKGKFVAESADISKHDRRRSPQPTEVSYTGSSTQRTLVPGSRKVSQTYNGSRSRVSYSRGHRARNSLRAEDRGQRDPQRSAVSENRARRVEHCWRTSPFSRNIEEAEPPRRFTVQTFKRYSGKTDPMEHILHYEQMMTLYRGHEALMCKVFPSTLEGSATTWFSKLPARSVRGWGQLVRLFLDRFVANNKPDRGLSDLLAVRKKDGESIREFSQRYMEMANEIEDCPPNLIAASFKMGLPRGSDLFKELAKRPPRNINELLRTVDEHTRLEDAMGNQESSTPNPNRQFKAKVEVNPRVNISGPVRNNRGTINAIFNSPMEEILNEVKDKGYFRWPQKLQGDPERRNKELHCAYHQTHGHRTEVCRQLKTHLDELADQGHLAKFVNQGQDGGRQRAAAGELRVIEAIHGFTKNNGGTRKELRTQGRVSAFTQQVNTVQTSSGKRDKNGSRIPAIIGFSDVDLEGVTLPHTDALVVTLQIGEETLVKRVFIDPGSNTEILYLHLFLKLGFTRQDLTKVKGILVGFGGHSTYPLGTITLPVVVHGVRTEVEFVVVDAPSPYNAILGRGWLHEMRAVPSTLHQKLKFPTTQGTKELRGDQNTARECCSAVLFADPGSGENATGGSSNLTENAIETKAAQ